MNGELLYSENERLVYKVYQDNFRSVKRNVEDLMQCGRMGLWKACTKWDESKSKFNTFAYYCILNEMRMFLRKQVKLDIREINEGEETEEGKVLSLFDIQGEEVDYYSNVNLENFLKHTKYPEIWEKISQGETIKSIAKESGVSKNIISRRMQEDRVLIKSKGLCI